MKLQKKSKTQSVSTNVLKMLTPEQYVEKSGNFCPVCKSSNISAEPVEGEDRSAWADCKCDDCKATWQDDYELKGYINLKYS